MLEIYVLESLLTCLPFMGRAICSRSIPTQLSGASEVKTLIHTRGYRGGYWTVWTMTLRISVNARRIVKVKVNREREK